MTRKAPMTKEDRRKLREWAEHPETRRILQLLQERTYQQAMTVQQRFDSGVDERLQALMRMHLVHQFVHEIETFLQWDMKKLEAELAKEETRE